jgi:hypothetical protein
LLPLAVRLKAVQSKGDTEYKTHEKVNEAPK